MTKEIEVGGGKGGTVKVPEWMAKLMQPEKTARSTGPGEAIPVTSRPATPTRVAGRAIGAGESRGIEVGQQPARRPEAGATSANPPPKVSEGSPRKEVHGLQIEIGNKTYVLSDEAQRYLQVDTLSDYPKTRSVLIIQEPHEDLEGQLNLYKGLEVFFRDNPDLISRTAFLAEGFPANQPISVRSLIEVIPNPSEELIWEVLSTFLITGYMAYEWKYQHGIPVIGTENDVLHRLASKTMSQRSDMIGVWNMNLVTRNKSIAVTLLEQTKKSENPILFVGGGHLDKLDTIKMLVIKTSRPGTILTPEEAQALKDWKNLGIRDYLEKERIGYTFLIPRNWSGTHRDEDRYERLFNVQQHGSYEEYITGLLSDKIWSTTVRPSPEEASKFLKAYLRKRPDNPEATAAAQRGFSLTGEGKFIAAAEEFSDASAAEPRIPGYVFSFQDSLLREFTSRVIRVVKDPKSAKCTINPSVEPDLPVFGPYMEKSHYQQVTHFAQRFAKSPRVQEVINSAMSRYWRFRYGGALQIKAAENLGPENIRAFEEKGKGRTHIDIATKDNIAIECKNFSSIWISSREIERWIEQAVSRFEADEQGHSYSGVIIVIPNHGNLEEIESTTTSLIELKYPKLPGKIRVSKLADLKENLYRLTRK